MTRSVALAAGGTGGHLLPALTVGAAIRAIAPEVPIVLIGSTRHLDATIGASSGFAVATTDVVSFSGWRDVPGVAMRLRRAVAQASEHLRAHEVGAVLGFGGYPSLPPILAAARLGLPRLVHEANALPRLGLANRIGARFGARVFGGFPTTGTARRDLPAGIGVPIRAEILTVTPADRGPARERWGVPPGVSLVVVVGGSLGARRLNDAVIAWAPTLPDGLRILLSTGATEYPRVAEALAADPRIDVRPYLEDMAHAYAAADVVVARAGASTVAELETLGTPAVLVPLPIARAGEQDANAAVLASTGQATVLADGAVTAPALAAAVLDRLGRPHAPGARHRAAAEQLALAVLEAVSR